MLLRRGCAIACAVLFLLPLAPALGAGPDCATEECRTLSLFVQGGSQGFSAIPGDGMPSDASTRAPQIAASTHVLESPLEIATDGAFRVVLSANAASPHVNATYTVEAVDLLGRSTLLASHSVKPNGTLISLDGGLARSAVDTSTDLLCAAPPSPANGAANGAARAPCENLNGDVGAVGTFVRPGCARSEPRSANGIQHWLAWYAIRSFDDRSTYPTQTGPLGSNHPAQAKNVALPIPSEEKLCRSRHDDLNASADALDGSIGAPPVTTEGPALAPHTDWKDVTFSLRPDHGLPMRGGFVQIAEGFRLVLRVDATTSFDLRSGPVEFEFGRADAPTRLEIQTPTSAFQEFARGREAIGPGPHTGVFANFTDADLFAVSVAPGETLSLIPRANVALSAWDPEGRFYSTASFVTIDEPGWTVRAMRPSLATPSPPLEYAFEVRPWAPWEGTVEVSNGTYQGSLGAGNDADHFTLFVWKWQHTSIRLLPGPGLDAVLHTDEPLWIEAANDTSLDARPFFTGPIELNVLRASGTGGYTLIVETDPLGNLSQVPTITPTLAVGEFVDGMSAYGSGVDARVGGEIIHFEGGTRTILTTGTWGSWSIPRDSAGAIYTRHSPSASYLARVEDGVGDPLADGGGAAFGADGGLYFSWPDGLARMLPDRSLTNVPVSTAWAKIFAPDGTLVVSSLDADWPSQRVDFENGTATPAPEYAGVEAFDVLGGFYRIRLLNLIEHVDPVSGQARVVAWSPDHEVRRIAAAENGLYVSLWPRGQGSLAGIAFVPMTTPGFEGFHPAFDVPPAADLFITTVEESVEALRVEDRAAKERHFLNVTITNAGGTVTPSTTLRASSFGLLGSTSQEVPLDPIAAAGSATVSLVWDAWAYRAGDQRITLFVDDWGSHGRVVESNETNNRLDFDIRVVVGGNAAPCEAALGPDHPTCDASRL